MAMRPDSGWDLSVDNRNGQLALFVLELTFEQEQCSSCEQILQVCEAGKANLIVPAYSLAEPHEKLNRQARSRRELQLSLRC
jgi:hypothetical protein